MTGPARQGHRAEDHDRRARLLWMGCTVDGSTDEVLREVDTQERLGRIRSTRTVFRRETAGLEV
jgi:hypothetical protein